MNGRQEDKTEFLFERLISHQSSDWWEWASQKHCFWIAKNGIIYGTKQSLKKIKRTMSFQYYNKHFKLFPFLINLHQIIVDPKRLSKYQHSKNATETKYVTALLLKFTAQEYFEEGAYDEAEGLYDKALNKLKDIRHPDLKILELQGGMIITPKLLILHHSHSFMQLNDYMLLRETTMAQSTAVYAI